MCISGELLCKPEPEKAPLELIQGKSELEIKIYAYELALNQTLNESVGGRYNIECEYGPGTAIHTHRSIKDVDQEPVKYSGIDRILLIPSFEKADALGGM